jgi:hypothetical protein
MNRSRSGSKEKDRGQVSKALRATNAHISIVGHITPEELAMQMGRGKGVDIANGFANRFLWTCVRRSRLLPEGGNAGVLDAFVEPMKDALEAASGIGVTRRDADAVALWAGVYEGLTAARPGAYGLAVSRGRAQVVRLSLLYALIDKSDTITEMHMRAALAVWAYCEASARRIFGGDGANANRSVDRVWGGGFTTDTPMPLHLRLLDAIAKSPGISRRRLHEATGNRIKAEDMEVALASLEAQRLAHRGRYQTASGGRPAECWWPGACDAPGDDDSADGGEAFTMGKGMGDDPHTDPCEQTANEQTVAPSLAPPASPDSVCSFAGFADAGADVNDGANATTLQTYTPPYLSEPNTHAGCWEPGC